MNKDEILSANLRFDKETNHEKGFCSFAGETAMQNYNAFSVIWDLLESSQPKTIIEIGTASGGFTRFLKLAADSLDLDARVITYDVNSSPKRKSLLNYGIEYREEQCFTKETEGNLLKLKDDIQSQGTTIVFCDGGHKITEFNILSEFIKSGDIILAHDYSYSKEIFESKIKNKIWNFCEVTYDKIQEAVEKNNLEPHEAELMNNVVWASFIKV